MELLETVLLPCDENFMNGKHTQFQNGNPSPHTAKFTISFLSRLEQKRKLTVITWPPYSPDLKPIENLWAVIDKRLKDRNPFTVAGLKVILSEGWDALNDDKQLLIKLSRPMPSRINACRLRKGRLTKYQVAQWGQLFFPMDCMSSNPS